MSITSIRRYLLMAICLLDCTIIAHAQVKVELRKSDGVYYVPCRVNGYPFDFILDTGASTILISGSAVYDLVKRGLISEEDVTGYEYLRVANGDIMEGMRINLKSFDIGGIRVKNVSAVVHLTMDAPLLLGTSTLERFGNVSIDYHNGLLFLGSEKNEFMEAMADMYRLHKYTWGARIDQVEFLESSEKWRIRWITGSYSDWKSQSSLDGKWVLKYKNRVAGKSLGKSYTFGDNGQERVMIQVLNDGVTSGNPDLPINGISSVKGYEIYALLDSMIRSEAKVGIWPEICVGESGYRCTRNPATTGPYNRYIKADSRTLQKGDYLQTLRKIQELAEGAYSDGGIARTQEVFIGMRWPISDDIGYLTLCLRVESNGNWIAWVLADMYD